MAARRTTKEQADAKAFAKGLGKKHITAKELSVALGMDPKGTALRGKARELSGGARYERWGWDTVTGEEDAKGVNLFVLIDAVRTKRGRKPIDAADRVQAQQANANAEKRIAALEARQAALLEQLEKLTGQLAAANGDERDDYSERLKGEGEGDSA